MIKEVFQKKFGECLLSKKPKMYTTNGLTSPLVFEVDKICERISCGEGKRCDEIVMCDLRGGAAGVYCVENKDRKPEKLKVADICKQLQGGADIVCKYLGEEERFCFAPVLATKRGIPATRRGELQRQNVHLRYKPHKIKVMIGANTALPSL